MKPEKLRMLADGMTAKIEEKLNPAVGEQNWTARRAAMAASIREDGQRLEKVQYMLYGMADAIEAGTLPTFLEGLKLGTKAILETVCLYPSFPQYSGANQTRILKAGFTPENYQEARDALMQLAEPPDHSEEDEARRIYNETRRLVGKIPGFFPTPKDVADDLVELASIGEAMTILEPSCGSGSILAAIAESIGTLKNVTSVEINPTLAQHTRNVHKIDVIQRDFMEWKTDEKFDRVIMNPPFEKFQDVDHVIKALSHLKSGGRLVSIMSPSWTFSKIKKAEEFRALVNDLGEFIEMDDGAFKESGTGVRSVIVILEAPN